MTTKKPYSHPVRNYDKPLVSIIIPVGPGHEETVVQALDSVWGQTEWRWECIVVNDTGGYLKLPYHWPRLANTGASVGAGAARNFGLHIAQGRYIVFLDADDYLRPEFLEKVLLHHRITGRYVYTDWYELRPDSFVGHHAEDYTIEAIFKRMSIHAITTLIPRTWIDDVGGFQEELPAWEDTDLFMKLAIAGHCGSRVPEPLFVYNYHSGVRREVGAEMSTELKAWFREQYGEYIRGDRMCKCNEVMQQRILNNADFVGDEEMVRVMMMGGGAAKTSIRGGATGTRYGRRQRGDILYMYPDDVRSAPDRFVIIDGRDDMILATTEPPPPQQLALQ